MGGAGLTAWILRGHGVVPATPRPHYMRSSPLQVGICGQRQQASYTDVQRKPRMKMAQAVCPSDTPGRVTFLTWQSLL